MSSSCITSFPAATSSSASLPIRLPLHEEKEANGDSIESRLETIPGYSGLIVELGFLQQAILRAVKERKSFEVEIVSFYKTMEDLEKSIQEQRKEESLLLLKKEKWGEEVSRSRIERDRCLQERDQAEANKIQASQEFHEAQSCLKSSTGRKKTELNQKMPLLNQAKSRAMALLADAVKNFQTAESALKQKEFRLSSLREEIEGVRQKMEQMTALLADTRKGVEPKKRQLILRDAEVLGYSRTVYDLTNDFVKDLESPLQREGPLFS